MPFSTDDPMGDDLLKSVRDKLLADTFRIDAELFTGKHSSAGTAQTQSDVSFSKMAWMYRKLMATRSSRKIYFVDPETFESLPGDMKDSPDVIILPGIYQEMLPRRWKRRKFHPPYRKPVLRPRWVATPKGIFAVEAPRSVFR